MDKGMLWFDDDNKRTLAQKVERAAEFYKAKHGQAANMCFVNPSALAEPVWVGDVYVTPLRTTLAHHLQIGVADPATLPARPELPA